MKLNGRWFPQIVDRTVGIYMQYIIHSVVLIFDPKRGGGGVVLASEPVGGRSRATGLPCFIRNSCTTHTLFSYAIS